MARDNYANFIRERCGLLCVGSGNRRDGGGLTENQRGTARVGAVHNTRPLTTPAFEPQSQSAVAADLFHDEQFATELS